MTVILLGVITSGLSLVALLRLLSTTTVQRVERAQEYVADQLARQAQSPTARRGTLSELPVAQVVGMQGGYTTADGDPGEAVPATWRVPIKQALADTAQSRQRVVREVVIPGAQLVVAAQPAADGSLTWTALAVRVPSYLSSWRWIVMALGLATLLLVVISVRAVVTVRSGAGALNAALVKLARDLSAPVPRPPVRELSDIADGIAELAAKLAEARATEEHLGGELAKQERLAALGRVVAGVAHEVRNPLASIKLRLDLAATTSPSVPAAVVKAIAHATSEITRLDRLVADLLVVVGRQLGPQKSTSMASFVQSRAEALAPWSQLRRIAVTVEGDATGQVDPDSMARALDNLLRNAVEASSPDQMVRVRISGGPDETRVRIEDQGQGVPAERIPQLFEPFFTTKPEGTGLGLAISRAIARAHGGDVVYVRDGATTRFELILPASAGAGVSPQRASA